MQSLRNATGHPGYRPGPVAPHSNVKIVVSSKAPGTGRWRLTARRSSRTPVRSAASALWLTLPGRPIAALAQGEESGGAGRQAGGRGGVAVTDDDLKIFVDATRPATLNDGAGKQTDFASLEEAVRAWRLLPSMVKIRATVKLI